MKKSSNARTSVAARRNASNRTGTPDGNTATVTDAAIPPTATPVAEETPQAPKSVYRQFTDRVAAIMRGDITPEEKLFQPLLNTDPNRVTVIGVITDPKARELLSLHTEYHALSLQLPYPRKLADVERYKRDTVTLKRLSEQAEKLAWDFIHDEFPGQGERGSLAISDSWVLVRKPDYEDQVRARAEERYGTTESEEAKAFIARHLAAREKEKLAEQKSDPFDKNDDDDDEPSGPREVLSALSRLAALGDLRRHM